MSSNQVTEIKDEENQISMSSKFLKKISTNKIVKFEKVENENDDDEKTTRIGLKRRTTKILTKLLSNGIFNLQKKEYIFSDTYRLLIEEISKPKLKENLTQKEKKKIAEDPTQRKVDKIQTLLKLLPGFKRFMKYYNIDDDAVRTAAGLIMHKRYQEGSYIFRQDDKSDYFYGIISGKISIRERKKIVKKEEVTIGRCKINLNLARRSLDENTNFFNTYIPYQKENVVKEVVEYIEEEKLTMKEGQCFGEWGLIYKKDRASSAYCLDTVDLFLLDAHSFDVSFSKCMAKAELDRKMFLMRSIPFFTTFHKHRFDILYKSFIAFFPPINSLVYSEGNKADTIFVIYQGSCTLEKNLNPNGKEAKNVKILYLESGDIAGVESTDYIPDLHTIVQNPIPPNDYLKIEEEKIRARERLKHPMPTYKTSLRAVEENTIIIQIKISTLNELRVPFCNWITPFKHMKEKIIENCISQKLETKNKTKPLYRCELMKRYLRLNEYEGMDDGKMTTQINEYVKNSKGKVIPRNDLKNYTTSFNDSYAQSLREKNQENKKVMSARRKTEYTEPKNVLRSSYYQNIVVDKNNDFEGNIFQRPPKSDKLISLTLAISKAQQLAAQPTKKGTGIDFSAFFNNVKKSLKEETITTDRDPKESLITDASTQRIHTAGNTIQGQNSSFTIAPNSTKNEIKAERLPSPIEENVLKSNRSSIKLTKTNNNSEQIQPGNSDPNYKNKLQNLMKTTSHFKAYFEDKNGFRISNKVRNLSKYHKENLILSKDVKNNLTNWNSTLKNRNFDSGAFEIPLLSLTERKK